MDEDEDDELDPRFCAFCQDATPAGKMLVVFQGTQEFVYSTVFKACERCGLHFTDSVIGTNESGRTGVLQFEHDDFHSEETQKALVFLIQQFENQVCHVCDESLPPIEDAPSHKDFATKVLRMQPEGSNVVFTCESCATLGLCECCNENDEG